MATATVPRLSLAIVLVVSNVPLALKSWKTWPVIVLAGNSRASRHSRRSAFLFPGARAALRARPASGIAAKKASHLSKRDRFQFTECSMLSRWGLGLLR